MDELFLIAEVKAIRGSEGYVQIESFTDFKERFFQLNEVLVEFFGSYKEFIVEDAVIYDGNIALKFKGFNSAGDAEIFLNKKIFVDKKNSVQLDKDTFFIHDVIGSKVYKDAELLGDVEDVFILPANDVFVVKGLNDRKILVPAVKDYVKDFDPIEKRLDLISDCDLLYDDEN